jgi:hypothetical protein
MVGDTRAATADSDNNTLRRYLAGNIHERIKGLLSPVLKTSATSNSKGNKKRLEV